MPEIAEVLLDAKADVNKGRQRDAMSPLMEAARTNNVKLVKLLLDRKVQASCLLVFLTSVVRRRTLKRRLAASLHRWNR